MIAQQQKIDPRLLDTPTIDFYIVDNSFCIITVATMELSRILPNRIERGLRRYSTGSSNIDQSCEQKDIQLDIFYSVYHHNSSNEYVNMPTGKNIARRSICEQQDNGIAYAPPFPLPEERDEIRYDDVSISSLYDWRSDLLLKPKRSENEIKEHCKILPSQANRTMTKSTIEPLNDLPLDFVQSDKYTEFCCSWPSNRLNHLHETKLKDITITSALLPLVLTNIKQTSTTQQGPLTVPERLHHLYSSSYPMGKKQLLQNEKNGIVTNDIRTRNKERSSVRTRASTPPILLRHVARPLESIGKDMKPTPPKRQRSKTNVIPFAMFQPRHSRNKDTLGTKSCEMKFSGLHEKIHEKVGPTLLVGQFIPDKVRYDIQDDAIKDKPFEESGRYNHSYNTAVIANALFSRWDSIEARSSPPRPYKRESKFVPANNRLTALSSSETMVGVEDQQIACERITSQPGMESDTTTGSISRQSRFTNNVRYSFASLDKSRLNKRIHLEHSRTKRRNIPILKDRFGIVKCTESVANNGLVLSPATRKLFIIPEETIDTAIHQSKRSCDSDETATFASCSTTNTPKLDFDNFQRQRRKRQRQMHKLAYLQHMQSTKSLGGSKLKFANDRAALQRLLVAASSNVERKEYLVGYGQYIDALQLCDHQGLTKSDPVMIEIRTSLKSMIDHIMLPSPFLCDTILAAIDSRADFESRRPKSIRSAIVTLKVALELRKAIMEKKVLSIGVASPTTCDSDVLKQSNKYPEFKDRQQRQHALDPVIRRSARSLLILSRCFHETGKHKCGLQAKKEADALFRTKRLHL